MPDILLKPGPTGNGIVPQMPATPTPAALAMKFSSEDGPVSPDAGGTTITTNNGQTIKEDKVTSGLQFGEKQDNKSQDKSAEKIVEKAIEEAPKKEEVVTPRPEVRTEEVKKVEEVVTTNGKPKITPITPVKKKDQVAPEADTFDYTKYSDSDKTNLKNMSRQSREAYVKLLDENKQLSSLKDSNYLQHEQGYTLSPEYRELQDKNYKIRTEGKCWEDALTAIKEGKKFRDIIGFDENGQAKLSEERLPTTTDEIRIGNNLSLCIQAAQQTNGQISQYPNQFKQRISQDMRSIDEEQKARFAWVSDPKLLDHPVDIEGRGEVKVRQIKDDFKSMFPSYLANTAAVDVAANLFVALNIQSSELRDAKNGQQVAIIKQQEVARGEPSSDTRTVENGNTTRKGVPSTFSLEGMPSR